MTLVINSFTFKIFQMTKIHLKTVLNGGTISLKSLPYQKIDPEYLANMANNPNIAKWLGHRFPTPYTKKDAIFFLKQSKSDWEAQEEYVFGIFLNTKYIGNIWISPDNQNRIFTNLGYWIAKDFEGNGYAERAVELLSKFCFRKLYARKIEASVYEGNLASIKVLSKNGFLLEGVKRKNYLLKNGQVLDKYIYGKLNTKMIDK